MSFLNRSLFQRTFWTLVPFAAAIALLYSLLLASAIKSTEDQVVKQYLRGEFERFSADFATASGGAALPRTSYLDSYWTDDPELDTAYTTLAEGMHVSADNKYQILVGTPTGSDRSVVMIVDEGLLTTLDDMEASLVAAISFVGIIVTLVGAILATYLARKLTQPIISLAEDSSEHWSPGKTFSGSGRQDEIGTLSKALTSLVNRLEQALEREQAFTRHASHEMRSPLAVIGNSLSLLKMDNIPEEKKRRSLGRIEQSCSELQMLLEVFLCLGREDFSIPSEDLDIERLLTSLLDRYAQTLESKGIAVSTDISPGLTLTVPPALFTILMNNMLRNAIHHGEKSITIAIDKDQLEIVNGMPVKTSTGHHGYGLEICRRVCGQLGWQFSSTSTAGAYHSVAVFAGDT